MPWYWHALAGKVRASHILAARTAYGGDRIMREIELHARLRGELGAAVVGADDAGKWPQLCLIANGSQGANLIAEIDVQPLRLRGN